MSAEEFDLLTDRLRGKIQYLFFHLMGEPTLHPLLPEFVKKASEKGFLPMLTTNGSLLAKCGEELLTAPFYKISISLHAPSANPAFADKEYFDRCADFALRASEKGIYTVLRLWNLGSEDEKTNEAILARLHEKFPEEWKPMRGGDSLRLHSRLFLEFGDRFDWPDPEAPSIGEDGDCFCHGLRDQVGVLVDGTVVPCCLDSEGYIRLGNLFETELDDILATPRARAIYDGFTRRRASEELCRRCGYARRFSKK
jgi:radical SAM protein with 4Fe4S-binding SPASM domain